MWNLDKNYWLSFNQQSQDWRSVREHLVAIQKIEVARGEISPFCFTGLKPAGIRHHGWLKATSSALTAPASTAAAILPPQKQGAVS
jgi:hypothetical protein